MTKGITGKEADPEVVYADIYHLPHHEPDHHPRMSLRDRAAQFAAYKTLSGFEDMINEQARQVDEGPSPSVPDPSADEFTDFFFPEN